MITRSKRLQVSIPAFVFVPCGPWEIAFPAKIANLSATGILVQVVYGAEEQKCGEIPLSEDILPLNSSCRIQLVPADEQFTFAPQTAYLVRREATVKMHANLPVTYTHLAFQLESESSDIAGYLHELVP